MKMNMSEKYLKEAEALEARWAKTGLLAGITKKYCRQMTAVLLEGQRLFYERAPAYESEKVVLRDMTKKGQKTLAGHWLDGQRLLNEPQLKFYE